MSLILDALNRAENERNKNPDSPEVAPPVADPSLNKPSSEKKKLILVAALAGGLMLVLLCLWLFSGSNDAPSKPSSTDNTKETPALKNVRPTNNENLAEKTTKVVALDNSQNLNTQQEILPTKVTIEKPAQNQASPKTNTKTAETTKNKAAIEALYAKRREKESAQIHSVDTEIEEDNSVSLAEEQEPSTTSDNFIEEDARQKQGAPSNNTDDSDSNNFYASVKGIRELPWLTQQRIPTLIYSEHKYNSEGNSYVTLNKQRLSKGGRLDEIRVVEIAEQGVILAFDNYQFKLDALSSWVNM